MKYWEEKVAIFGDEKAFKKLTLQSLEEEDRKALNERGIQVLPGYDESGRSILLSCRFKWGIRESPPASVVRIITRHLEDFFVSQCQ